jgi:hypothetical protein
MLVQYSTTSEEKQVFGTNVYNLGRKNFLGKEKQDGSRTIRPAWDRERIGLHLPFYAKEIE